LQSCAASDIVSEPSDRLPPKVLTEAPPSPGLPPLLEPLLPLEEPLPLLEPLLPLEELLLPPLELLLELPPASAAPPPPELLLQPGAAIAEVNAMALKNPIHECRMRPPS
jgi:hypothetical protein